MRRREWEIKDPFVSKMPLPPSLPKDDGRTTESMMDIRDFLFPAVVPLPPSFLALLSQAPFDIGKVEAAAAFHFPFARGPTLLSFLLLLWLLN